MQNQFYEFAVILAIAAVLGAIGRLLRQPLIVTFIAVGICVGPAWLGIATAGDEVDLLARTHYEIDDTASYPIAGQLEKPFRLSELPERIACAHRPEHSAKAVVRAK